MIEYTDTPHVSDVPLECLGVHMPNENEEKGTGWGFISLFPFVPSEPAGIQHFFLSLLLSLAFPPPNSLSLMSLFPAQ